MASDAPRSDRSCPGQPAGGASITARKGVDMKTITALTLSALLLAGTAAAVGPKTADVIPLFLRVADADGAAVGAQSPGDTPLYTAMNIEHQPVIAPDGRHVTLEEFLSAGGTATVECTEAGTRSDLVLSGLIPNGVYTVWLFAFAEPGYDGTMANAIGAGAYGPFDADQNAFTATETGEASLTMVAPAGLLSTLVPTATEQHTIGPCLLTDEYEFHLVGTYHMDHQTHGAVPGPPGSEAFQFGFIFINFEYGFDDSW
jgi:hypothetical protein